MRVLWFLNTPFNGDQIGSHISGGRGGWLSNLAGLVRDEIDLSIAYVDPYAPRCTKAGGVTAFAIRPTAWNARLLLSSAFNYRSIREFPVGGLLDIIDAAKPDLIHIHGTEKGYIELLGGNAKVDAPILLSIQGVMQTVSRFYTGGYDQVFLQDFWYRQGDRALSFLPKRMLANWKYSVAQAAREREYFPHARFVDGRTRYDRSFTEVMAPNAVYFHIDRVLRPTFYSSAWGASRPTSDSVMSTMSDALWKGFDLVADATRLIARIRPEFRWKIAGLSPSSICVAAARKRMGRLFPEHHIEFLGSLDSEGLAQSLAKASAFVLPSYIENSPNSLAEAQMMGVPCIGTDSGGTSSYLKNGITGELVPAGDPLGLAAAILSMLENPVDAAKMGAAGREVALARHAPSRVKGQVLNAYESIMSKTGGC